MLKSVMQLVWRTSMKKLTIPPTNIELIQNHSSQFDIQFISDSSLSKNHLVLTHISGFAEDDF